MIKVEQQTALEKDPTSNAVVNVSHNDYHDFMAAHFSRINEKKQREDEINSRIDNLERGMSDIKMMLEQLLKK